MEADATLSTLVEVSVFWGPDDSLCQSRSVKLVSLSLSLFYYSLSVSRSLCSTFSNLSLSRNDFLAPEALDYNFTLTIMIHNEAGVQLEFVRFVL